MTDKYKTISKFILEPYQLGFSYSW